MPSLVAVGFSLPTIRASGTIPFGDEAARGGESGAVRAVVISEQAEV